MIFKGQLILKQNCRAITSPKKRAILSWVRFFHFLGEVTARQLCFEIYWPLQNIEWKHALSFRDLYVYAQNYCKKAVAKHSTQYKWTHLSHNTQWGHDDVHLNFKTNYIVSAPLLPPVCIFFTPFFILKSSLYYRQFMY